MENKIYSNNHEFGLLNLLYAIVQKKNFVLIFTVIFAIIAIVYSLLTPKLWVSTTTIQPITESNDGINLDTGLLDMLGGGILSNAGGYSSDQFVAIMESRTFSEDVIRKFDLIRYFNIKSDNYREAMENATKKLKSRIISISIDPKISIITISVETKDKNLSQQIAQYYVQQLDKYNRYVKMTKSRMKREFLEKNVDDVKVKIDSLGIAMKDFQSKYHVVAPDQQTQSMISLYSEAISALAQTDLELEMARQSYGGNSPQIVTLQKRKSILTDRLKDLEGKNAEINPKYMLQIDKIPDISLRYAHLTMNLEIQKKIFEFLYPQFEAAKLDELRDMPTMQIIDKANLAGLRSKPKRALIVIMVTLSAFLLASIISIIVVFIPESQKSVLKSILKELNFKKY
ncbi:MAG TPA: Wzz/FepE/Etk N-terminal domain-containing protein [Candidatus Cloacimonadota bacterium]|nr:Wzz/FepE/Etk N-terminal domain-containing protein [Candidatus Cloacimonadota bacterium]